MGVKYQRAAVDTAQWAISSISLLPRVIMITIDVKMTGPGGLHFQLNSSIQSLISAFVIFCNPGVHRESRGIHFLQEMN